MIGWRQTPSADPEEESMKGFDDFELRLGDVMRGERATLGKSLLDVQRELKIRATYIAAIENADPTAFETPGFVAGYVRSYARYLGLDPEWAFNTFCEEGEFEAVHGMDAAASPRTLQKQRAQGKQATPRDPLDALGDPNAMFVPRSPAIWSRIEPGAIGSVLVLCLLVAGLGFGGWTVLQQIQRVTVTPVEQTPDVFAQIDPLAGATIAPEADTAISDAANEQALSRLYRPQPLDVPVLIARDGPISTLQPGSLGALADLAPTAPALVERAPAVAEADLSEDTPVKVIEDAYPAVAVAALRPAWVRITAADGTVLFEKILDAGESYDLPSTENPARLRAGNSGSVYFVVDGEAYGPASPGAAVVKNISLAASDLKDGYELVDPRQHADVATMVAELRSRWEDAEITE
ncbi:4-hydroxy-3-methylbut-2-en-1-yl diphosphate synthase [Actibacterium mucosum KCTC 23349]|uniref:4-hydroxy-3-methylbut-2-en-1-yl diphosphate synthase n=1 Tax=Actibacterium mucosum KCTC 23349 TaxID=1454373 RepID=A0A037ZEB2_9RHOB|nr:helix-turn-helix domain-containing protein [Actibacterium mucosum]KAJ54457.1 4-hydroxy-3-methylbut-2-en-1-yl diphosphate synthase [Actibacterium mucosum KCTC 23349]